MRMISWIIICLTFTRRTATCGSIYDYRIDDESFISLGVGVSDTVFTRPSHPIDISLWTYGSQHIRP